MIPQILLIIWLVYTGVIQYKNRDISELERKKANQTILGLAILFAVLLWGGFWNPLMFMI